MVDILSCCVFGLKAYVIKFFPILGARYYSYSCVHDCYASFFTFHILYVNKFFASCNRLFDSLSEICVEACAGTYQS